jgi:hypothetical protein
MANAKIFSASFMTLSVRQLDVQREAQSLTKFLLTYLSPQADETRFDWLYLKNPEGRARVWIATLPDNQQTVGVASAFPRRLQDAGNQLHGWVLGDFCIHPKHRSLGPALSLQRQCLEDLTRGGADLVYDFPSGAMLSVYKRLKMESKHSMVRFAKPLRLDRKIFERVPISALARFLSIPCNIGLRIWERRPRRKNELAMAFQYTPCGEEFTAAAKLWGLGMGISVVRTAEYLNWRYFRHPQAHHVLLTARRMGELVGYLVIRQDGQDAAIVDMLAGQESLYSELLLEATSIFRARGVQTLSFPISSSSPQKAVLVSCGFHPRESRPIVLVTPAGWQSAIGDRPAHRWYLMDGDRES